MDRFSVQLVTFFLAIMGISIWAIYYRRRLWLAAPAIFWLGHVAVYYICVLWLIKPPIGTELFTTWSAIIRLHAVVTLVFVPFVARSGDRYDH